MEVRLLFSAYTLSSVAGLEGFAAGNNPQSKLVADSDGDLYGAASAGGAYGDGTVFEVAAGSGTVTALASFNGTDGAPPAGTVALDASGNLYGTTEGGGAFGFGTVFEIANGSDTITTLDSFNGTNGMYADSGLTLDSAGNLYGTTNGGGQDGDGTAFEIAKGSSAITTLASFDGTDGANPNAVILDAYGDLFGTTQNGGISNLGTIFEIPSGTGVILTLASFYAPNDNTLVPGHPDCALAFDAAGNLYGTTPYEFTNMPDPDPVGTVFELTSGSSSIKTLVADYGITGSGVTIDASGNIYGTTTDGVFEIATDSKVMTTIASFTGTNGNGPSGPLTRDASGDLFGTAYTGALNNEGVVFKIPGGNSAITVIATFTAISGTYPFAGLSMDASGNLYGTTDEGGPNNDGTVFEIARGSNAITTLASFNGTDGSQPQGPVTVDQSGNLYGTIFMGGNADYDGTVFEIAKGSNTITTLALFNGADGSNPLGGPTLDASGNLYGVTEKGGAYNGGSIFEVASDSGAITTLASFNGTYPEGGVTLDASGNLYGTTDVGGSKGDGSVFEIANGSNTITTIASFNNANGQDPLGLSIDAAGDLYGAAYRGGANGDGTIFEIPKGTGTITVLASFDSTTGSEPQGVTLDPSGDLFGTTGSGTAFEVARGSGTITTLATFTADSLNAPLTPDGLGNFYGTTQTGGPAGVGNVFELNANTTVALAPSMGPSTARADEPLTFTAAVSGGVPDGETVSLIDTGNNNALVATGTLSGGTTMLTVPADTLSPGTHNLIAVYGGDANFAASESAPYTQTILGVTGISPSSGPATGGTTVIITGGGFTGATAVDFGSTLATSFTVNSSGTQITAVDPAGTVGTTVDVTVVTSAGTTDTSVADQFTYLPSWLAAGSAATWNAFTDMLSVTGSATIISDPGSAEPKILANGRSAKLTIDPATSPTDVHIGGVSLFDGASIVMSDVDAAQVADGTNAANHHTDHNVLVIGTAGAVNDPTIAVDPQSKLDLGDNDLIIHTGSSDRGAGDGQASLETNELKAIAALAATGRNVAPGGVYDGTWTGNGLTSSAAATADDAANAAYEQDILAVEQNSDMYLGGYQKWTVGSASETLGANDIIVKYTYNGDLNLDGAVDGNAATIFSTFYDGGATSGNTYAYGDLNGDGKINGNDATICATVFGNGLAGSGLPQL